MIVALGVATGACIGAAARPRTSAADHRVCSGMCFPPVGTGSRLFEPASGVVALLVFAVAYGALEPVTVGAASAAAPDFEHVLSLSQRGGQPLFPIHRWKHLADQRPGAAQFVLACVLLARLLAHAGRDRRPPSGRR